MSRRDLFSDLLALKRAAREAVLTLSCAADALQLSHRKATLRMRALARLGAVHRIARGLYFIVPLNAMDPRSERRYGERAVAAALFSPCYVGGWSAAEAWMLYFGDRMEVFVVTSRRVRAPSVRVGEIRFRLAHLPERLISGPGILSEPGRPSAISDPERTLVDALRSPSWMEGARPLARALRDHRYSEDWDPDHFVDVLSHAGGGGAIKRLSVLNRILDLGIADVVDSVAERRTRGIVDLEPGAGRRGRIDTRYGVRVNIDLDGEDAAEEEGVEFPEDFEDRWC